MCSRSFPRLPARPYVSSPIRLRSPSRLASALSSFERASFASTHLLRRPFCGALTATGPLDQDELVAVRRVIPAIGIAAFVAAVLTVAASGSGRGATVEGVSSLSYAPKPFYDDLSRMRVRFTTTGA